MVLETTILYQKGVGGSVLVEGREPHHTYPALPFISSRPKRQRHVGSVPC